MKTISRLVEEARALLVEMDRNGDPHDLAVKLEWTLREAHAKALRHERRLVGEREPKRGD